MTALNFLRHIFRPAVRDSLTTCRTANMFPPNHPNAIPTRHEVKVLVRHSLQDVYELLNKTDLGFSQLVFSIFLNLNLL